MVILLLFISSQAFAKNTEIIIAAGAGYKQMVNDISAICVEDYDLKINGFFGNLGQIMAQISNSDKIEAVIADKTFFDTEKVQFSGPIHLGNGKLVLAWRKGIVLQNPADLQSEAIKAIAIPNTKKAIYGRAGLEFLTSSTLHASVKDKLVMVRTVPQVTSYIITGEVDAGFANLTDILKAQDKIGGFLLLESGYNPIEIRSMLLLEHRGSKSSTLYQQCLGSEKVKDIARKHGL